MPKIFKPMFATLVDKPFDDPDWIFEVKWDGYRAMTSVGGSLKGLFKVQIYSRKGMSYNEQYPLLVQAFKDYPHEAVFDGEIVALDNIGRPIFQNLQNYGRSGKGALVYYIFDILYFDGRDLRALPLLERKNILKKALRPLLGRSAKSSVIRLSDYVLEMGKKFFEIAKKMRLEGIIAKDGRSVYEEGRRTKTWLKIKLRHTQEAVIGGLTPPKGSRKAFGALVLGVYDHTVSKSGRLKYIGHVGTGFDQQSLTFYYNLFKPYFTKKCPFKLMPKVNSPVKWMKPKFIAEISFAEWTEGGHMRQPVFLGLREDKNVEDVSQEKPLQVGLALKKESKNIVKVDTHLTNLKKVYWPEEAYTKQYLVEYYKSISNFILPYLMDRPLTLKRYPDGIKGPYFYQKNMRADVPSWLKTIKIYSERDQKNINYLLCNDKETLIYLANLGCIEMHVWNARFKQDDYPDYLVFDLDPLEIGFDKVIETALGTRKVLDNLGVDGFCKTSGATGLHIYIPLGAAYKTADVVNFANLLGHLVHAKLPKITSLERSPLRRRRKVYLDYLQNRRHQTMVSPYSLRPLPGATVSTPLKWSEVREGLDPGQFTMRTTLERLERFGDLWKPVLGPGVDLLKVIEKIQKMGVD